MKAHALDDYNIPPAQFAVERKLSTPLYLVRKQVEDVMGGESEWKGVPTTVSSSTEIQ